MIRHMVHIRFKHTVNTTTKKEIMEQLRQLQNHVEGIRDFQYRDNISVETNLVRGFLTVFWFDFVDACARDRYLQNRQHAYVSKQLVSLLDNGTEGVFVCDIAL